MTSSTHDAATHNTATHPPAPRDTPHPDAPRPAVLHRRARAATARSAAGDRTAMLLLGLVLLAVGVGAALLSFGVFGAGRATRPVLDPVVLDVLGADLLITRIVALAVALVLLILGLMWTARSLRPERRPDLVLDRGSDGADGAGTAIVVAAGAAADGIGRRAATLPGVTRARSRLVGSETAPALRLTLWLADDAVVRDVLAACETTVLAEARRSMGLAALPVAVRLELDSTGPGPRVA